MQNLQEGASFIASKSEAPIVPVVIKGEYNRKKGVTIVFGKPINTEEFLESGNTRKDLTRKLEENLNNLHFQNNHLTKGSICKKLFNTLYSNGGKHRRQKTLRTKNQTLRKHSQTTHLTTTQI